MRKQNLDFEVARDFLIYLALNRYGLWSWNYSAHAVRYSILFSEKAFVISLSYCY